MLIERLLGVSLDVESLEPASPEQVAGRLPDPASRQELIEHLVLLEILCRPIPLRLEVSMECWALALDVDDCALLLARDLMHESQARATADFYRFKFLLEHYGTAAYSLTLEPDPLEAQRWQLLELCPVGEEWGLAPEDELQSKS